MSFNKGIKWHHPPIKNGTTFLLNQFLVPSGMPIPGKNKLFLLIFSNLTRFTDSDENPTVFGRIKVGDVYVCAQAADQFELGIKLDQLVTMVYYGLI